MATLKFTWKSTEVYELWSWSPGATHLVARTVKRHRDDLYTALMGPLGQEPAQLVFVKIARGPEAMDNLKYESEFYTNDLLHLQGTVVPMYYGLYRTKIKGVEFGCSLMEFCAGHSFLDPRELNRQVMLAVCKLHEAGVSHNNLLQSRHHIVQKGVEVRVVDFSTATRHKCFNAVPTLYSSRPQGLFCGELIDMEKSFGVHSDPASIPHAMLAAKAFWG